MELIRSQHGLMAKIARELGLSRPAVTMWDKVNAERLPEVCRITGFTHSQLRPDLYPEQKDNPTQ